VVGLADQVKDYAVGWNKAHPGKIHLSAVGDSSEYIKLRIQELGSQAIGGVILVLLVLFFGLGGRIGRGAAVLKPLIQAIIVSLAIPFAFITAFIVFHAMDQTINNISMFALILVVGLIVDGAIVIVENIDQKLDAGMERKKAAVLGTEEVGRAVLSGTVTTMVVFFPMLLLPGVMGQFMKVLPLTILASLAGALLFDHAGVPALLSRIKMPKAKTGEFLGGIKRAHKRFLEWIEFLISRGVPHLRGFWCCHRTG